MALLVDGPDAEENVVFGNGDGEASDVSDGEGVLPQRGGGVAPDNFVAGEVGLDVGFPFQSCVVGEPLGFDFDVGGIAGKLPCNPDQFMFRD